MEHETITLARRATTLERPEPTAMTRQPDGVTFAAAQETAADRTPGDGPATRPGRANAPELERLGDQIAELSARIDAATYELLCHLREFDRRHGWEGWRSCAHWLNWRTGLDLGAAREKLRVAGALADLNHVAAAMARGQLSYSKVRALTRVATPATEARLLAVALSATAAHVERLVRAWRRADRDAAPDAEQERLASRTLSMRVDEGGMVVLRGRLTPEVGAVLLRAVEAALEQVPASAAGDGDEARDDTTIAQRRADALGLVAESALAGGLDPGNSADRFQVTVHVQADTLAAREAADEARRVSAETRSTSPAAVLPPSASAHATPHVSAEARATGPVASETTSAAAHFAPHVAAEPRMSSPAGKVPASATADPTPHTSAARRAANPDGMVPPSTEADAAPHVSAEAWERGARPEGNTIPGIAVAGRPLRDTRSWNSRSEVTADTAPGACPAPAVRPPFRDESARCGGGGATLPLTQGPASVPPIATVETRMPEPNVPTANLAAPCSGRDELGGAEAETWQVSEGADERASWTTDLDAGQAVIEQAGGLHVGREAARRLACDAGLVVLSHGADGEVLDVGRRTRTVPSALRRALQSRDRSRCQFPGCDSRRCDAHHVEHWADGGATRLQNLVSLCRFHHRAVHEAGFRVVAGEADGQFRFLRPDGEPLPAEPPASSWNGAPLAPTEARLAVAGVSIGPHTATPEWYGESLDLTAALDVLWEPSAAAARGSS